MARRSDPASIRGSWVHELKGVPGEWQLHAVISALERRGVMNEVRILVQGVTKDAEAFGAFMKSEAEALEEAEPGTLLMEVFLDPASGAVVVHERYADADAFLAHSERLMQSDRLQRFLELIEIKRMTFLTPIEDERVATVAAQLHAIRVSRVAGFAR